MIVPRDIQLTRYVPILEKWPPRLNVSKTVHVSLSSITPHVDDLSAAAKGAEVKEGMKRVAEESGWQYICNHDNFLCCNDDVNMELVPIDGHQLSKLGTERLIKNPQTQ